MERVVQHILSCEEKLDDLQKYLTKEKDVLEKNALHIDEALTTLNFREHSLGALHLLAQQATSKIVDKPRWITRVASFLFQCSPQQIQLDPTKCVSSCDTYSYCLSCSSL